MTHYFVKYFLHLYHFYQKLNYLLVESLLWANFALVWGLTFISIPVWFRIRLFFIQIHFSTLCDMAVNDKFATFSCAAIIKLLHYL